MWRIETQLFEILGKKGKRLPPTDVFVSIYFKKIRAYLQSAHILTCFGFVNPSAYSSEDGLRINPERVLFYCGA